MPTFPSLSGFDMVYAVTENTINSQFAADSIRKILPTQWVASVSGGLYSINAQLGIPSVTFNTGDSSTHQVALTIPLTTATFNYASVMLDSNGNPVVQRQSTDISGSTLTLTANLDLADIGATYATASHVPDEVKAQLDKFDPSMFDMQHLFMDLEDVNLLNSFEIDTNGRVDTTQPELVGQLRNLLTAYINGLKSSGNPYILGYSVTNKSSPEAEATWVPTGVNFSVYSDTAFPTRSSLNYLLETANKDVPGGGSGIFTSNWVSRDDVQGTFVFSPSLVMDEVLASVAARAGCSESDFTANADGSFSASIGNDIGGQTTIGVGAVSGTNTIAVAFHLTYKKEMYDRAGSDIGFVNGTIDWTSTMTFSVDSAQGTVNVNVSNSPVQTTKNSNPNALGNLENYLSVFADLIISVATFGQVNTVFQDMVSQDWTTTVGTNVGLSMQSVATRIILPAGNELIFKDCTFLGDGTMLLATTVKN